MPAKCYLRKDCGVCPILNDKALSLNLNLSANQEKRLQNMFIIKLTVKMVMNIKEVSKDISPILITILATLAGC